MDTLAMATDGLWISGTGGVGGDIIVGPLGILEIEEETLGILELITIDEISVLNMVEIDQLAIINLITVDQLSVLHLIEIDDLSVVEIDT